ncbi:MAG: S41 family peptidase [Deltaproteobacteria bacterium]|nr:S41 family peptidase [Deltaproteobacteria bacterium]
MGAGLTGLAGGVFVSYRFLFAFVPPAHIPTSAQTEFRLMAEAWNLVDRFYVDRAAVKPRRLAYGAISGLVNALGDTGHSGFLTPEMAKEARNLTQGGFEGIGAEVQMKDDRVVVVAPMDGSPAQRAGLRPGDVILKVDGVDVSGLPLEQVVARILGRAGTKVTLSILRPATKSLRDITLTRARILIHSVTWRRLPGTDLAHVRIASFSKGVTTDLRAALREVRKEDLRGVILDLRNDPGGLLDEAIGVASQFLEHGNVLLEKDAAGKIVPVPVEPGGVLTDLPLAVLVNQGSASAAEIVAGSLKGARRAKVVGETTFGTGTVLNQFTLSDGSAVLLATQEWLTPDGRTIWHEGIRPDVPVVLPTEVVPLTPAVAGAMSHAKLQASGDRQLIRAISVLSKRP